MKSAFKTVNLIMAIFLAIGAVMVVPATPAHASTLTVTNTNDSGAGSLREAISNAANGDVIDATGISGTIVLSSELNINKNISILGPGSSQLTISGNDAVRVFYINSGKIVSITGVTVANGHVVDAHGAGINNTGNLTLDDVIVKNNVIERVSSDYNRGGGIHNYDGSTLIISDSIIENNTATQNGGGIHIGFNSTASLQNVIIRNNQTTHTNSAGGGLVIRLGSTVTMDGVSIIGNSALNAGGGLYSDASLTITDSLIANNSTLDSGSAGSGGGINIGGSGQTINLENVTISGNSATNTVDNAQGGGIFISQGTVNINNTTISNNQAEGAAGGLYIQNGTTVNINNSITGSNLSVNNNVEDCQGTLNSLGHNLIQVTAGCTINGDTTGNITNTDPKLAPLANYGGSMMTQALLYNSPAIDAGDDSTCTASDQRGVARPTDGNGDLNAVCDMGAYEYEQENTAPTVASVARASANPTSATSVDFTITFSEPMIEVETGDLSLVTTGTISGASITNLTGSGTTRTVTINTGTGDGTLRLDIPNTAVIKDLSGNQPSNLTFTGETYTITKVPVVSQIIAADTRFKSNSTASFTVTFSENVSGVDISDFQLLASDLTNSSITNVSGSGQTYTVSLRTGTGKGTIQLRVVDNDTIKDISLNALGGTGIENGNFTSTDIIPVVTGPSYSFKSKDSGTEQKDNTTTNQPKSETAQTPVEITTNSNGPAQTYNTPILSAPKRRSPASAAILATTPTFHWTQVPGGITYQFQYDNNEDFSSPTYTVGVNKTYHLPPHMAKGTYFWHVRVQGPDGQWSNWSPAYTVTIIK